MIRTNNETCIYEQFLADFLLDGINEKDIWLDHICLADVMIVGEIEG